MLETATTADWTQLREHYLGKRGKAASAPPGVVALIRALALMSESTEPAEVDTKELTAVVASDARFHDEVARQLRFNLDGRACPGDSIESLVESSRPAETRLLLISSAVHSVQEFSKSRLINGRNFWAANHERGLFAWEVATLLGADRFLAFTGAMVQDFLLPYLTTEYFDSYLTFLEAEDSDARSLPEFERQTFGWDHARAAAGVMSAWGFPDDLVCCVLFHHGGFSTLCNAQLRRTAVAAVAIASLVPDSLGQSANGLQQLARLQECWVDFDLLEIAQRVDERLLHIERRRLNHIPLWRRCRNILGKQSTP